MKQVVLFSFTKKQLARLLNKLGMEIDEKGKVIYKETGEVVQCHICSTELTKDNVGNVMPGSRVVLCDNPCCFLEYSAEKNIV
jgi:hypothetical protein